MTSPNRVGLSQEFGAAFTIRIGGSLTLVKGQQMCVNTTAILEVGKLNNIYSIQKLLPEDYK